MLFFAINEGRLSGPDDTVRTYVQRQFPGQDLIAKDFPITFRHFANQMSGYALPEAPGDAWAYNDYAIKVYAHLLFGQVFGVSPISATQTAAAITAPERLGPLQFQDGSLTAIVKGAPRWNATLRDTARFGLVLGEQGTVENPAASAAGAVRYLREGAGACESAAFDESHPERLPRTWYRWGHRSQSEPDQSALRLQLASTTSARMARWMVPGAPADLFFAQGNANKFIAMVPSQNLVAVWRDGPDLTHEQRAAALAKLSSAVV